MCLFKKKKRMALKPCTDENKRHPFWRLCPVSVWLSWTDISQNPLPVGVQGSIHQESVSVLFVRVAQQCCTLAMPAGARPCGDVQALLFTCWPLLMELGGPWTHGHCRSHCSPAAPEPWAGAPASPAGHWPHTLSS